MENAASITTTLPLQVLTRPAGQADIDWQELDSGPGYIAIPPDVEVMLRVKGIDDGRLAELVRQVETLPGLTALNLSENRNITDAGLAALKVLPGLTFLNLSSCSLTSTGLDALRSLPRLKHLNLSYCNRLTDAALKPLRSLNALEYLDLQGCVKITNGGVARLSRRGLTIHK